MNLTPKEKFALHREVRARADVPVNYRLIFAAALDYYNCDTGRCDPSCKTLGTDTAFSEHTARRALQWLAKHGLTFIETRPGFTSKLTFPKPNPVHLDGRTTPSTHMDGPQDEPRPNEEVTPATHVDGHPGHLDGRRTIPIKEPLNTASKYAFEGRVIRLTVSDFTAWKEANVYVELKSYLLARDAWLAEQPRDVQAKWFASTARDLANQNAKAKAAPPSSASAPQSTYWQIPGTGLTEEERAERDARRAAMRRGAAL